MKKTKVRYAHHCPDCDTILGESTIDKKETTYAGFIVTVVTFYVCTWCECESASIESDFI